MNKFDIVFRGYNKTQVNEWIDQVINRYDILLDRSKTTENENQKLREKLVHFNKIEDTLNRAILTAENASDQIKKMARAEAESLINEARKNANRIINDALLKADRAQEKADVLNRNVNIYKRKLRTTIESHLDIIDEIDRLEFRSEDTQSY